MSFLGGIASGVGSLLGGVVSTVGQLYSNAQSLDFAEKAAKSKYRWQVKDMEAAGLNPKLAATQGASGAVAPNLGNPGAGVGQGIAQAAQLASQYMLAQSAANKNNMEAALAVEQGLTQGSARNQMQADAELKSAQQRVAIAQSLLIAAQTSRTEEEAWYYKQLAYKISAETAGIVDRNLYEGHLNVLRRRWLDENWSWAVPLQMFGSSAKDTASIAEKLSDIFRLIPSFRMQK